MEIKFKKGQLVRRKEEHKNEWWNTYPREHEYVVFRDVMDNEHYMSIHPVNNSTNCISVYQNTMELVPTMTQKEKYIAAQEAFVSMTGLEKGSKVKVLRKAKDCENGWGAIWNDNMDNSVGKTFTVDYINGEFGISSDWNFPFFVLEVISNPEKLPDLIPLNDKSDYSARFLENGDISVGCQDISYDTLKKIYDTATTVKKGGDSPEMHVMNAPDGIYEVVSSPSILDKYLGINIRIEGKKVYPVRKGDTMMDEYYKSAWSSYTVKAVK